MRRICLAFVLCLITGSASAAQIVALDLKAGGGVQPALASALNDLLLVELGRREGMSVVSQSDVRALLELEANKQMLGCNDTSCMTEIAGSMGAELMVASTLAKVGTMYVATLVLIQVDSTKVVRRTTGNATGPETVAAEAIQLAVHSLFKDGLPVELMGPASLTRRGFKAALAGFFVAVVDPSVTAKPSRRRVVLDLVNTELDYDVKPKFDALDLDIRRSIGRLRYEMLLSKDAAELEHYLRCVEQYRALADDLGRVREIRERSRERGIVPSARPLRFETPEVGERTSSADMARYTRESAAARKIAVTALDAYRAGNLQRFSAFWPADKQHTAKNEITGGRESDKRYEYTYDLLPLHATPPRLMEQAMDALGRGQVLVFLRRYKKGKIYDDEYARFEKIESTWRITSW